VDVVDGPDLEALLFVVGFVFAVRKITGIRGSLDFLSDVDIPRSHPCRAL